MHKEANPLACGLGVFDICEMDINLKAVAKLMAHLGPYLRVLI